MTRETDGPPAGKPAGAGRPGAPALGVVLLTLAACGATDVEAEADRAQAEPITLYTCLSDESIRPVLAAYEESEDGARSTSSARPPVS